MKRTELADTLQESLELDELFDNEEVQSIIPTMNKPVISADVEEQALDAIAQYQNRELWTKWGMDSLRTQGACILISGPPGTGKTTLAKWLAKKVGKGFISLSSAEVGGGDPGESERNIVEFFTNARKRKNATIFMDECDHMLMDRAELEDTTWQLGSVETLMVQVNTYPGLIMMATNHPEKIDPAMADRFLAMIHIGKPDLPLRIKLWRTKVPRNFPFQPTDIQIKELAKAQLTGRTIETVIVAVASHCIRKGIRPNMKHFHMFIERELGKKLPSSK